MFGISPVILIVVDIKQSSSRISIRAVNARSPPFLGLKPSEPLSAVSQIVAEMRPKPDARPSVERQMAELRQVGALIVFAAFSAVSALRCCFGIITAAPPDIEETLAVYRATMF